MSLCKTPKKFNKKLSVCLDVKPKGFDITSKKERISQKSGIQIGYETSIPDPIVFRPLTPTKYDTQRIKGLRPSDEYTVEINGTTAGVKYNGREFFRKVDLYEGVNVFDVKLVRGKDKGNSVSITIEKDSIPPSTVLKANGILVTDQVITRGSFDVSFEAEDSHGPITTYFRVNNGITQVAYTDLFVTNEGDFQIEFWSKDSLGNEEVPHNIVSLIIDRTPPTRPIIDIEDVPYKTRFSNLPIHGTKSVDAVQVYVNDVSATFDDSEHWHVLVPLMIEGVNVITAIAFDEAGNASASSVVSVIRDQIPPTIPFLISPDPRTRASSVRLIGGHSQDTYSMLLNEEADIIRLTNSIRWAADVELSEGPNIFDIISLDDVENRSETLHVIITKDTTAPNPPTIDPVISPTNNVNQLLTGTCDLDTVKIIIDNNGNVAHVNGDGTWRAIFELPHENLNIVTARAEDDLGNRSLPATVAIILDRVPPHPPTFDPTPQFSNIQMFVLTGDKSSDTVEVLINGSSIGVTYPTATRWTKTASMVLGSNIFEARGKDWVGNISASNEVRIFYKTSLPFFTIDPFPSEVLTSSIKITGSRELASTVQVNSSYAGVNYPDGLIEGVRWEAILNLTVGFNSFMMKATDRAGNDSLPQQIGIIRSIPIVIENFSIDSVYAFGRDSSKRVKNAEGPLPLITSREIRSFYMAGTKQKNTEIVTNFGKAEMPDGVEGKSWTMIISAADLARNVLNITLKGRHVIQSPEIIVSQLIIARNIFVGTISINIGGVTGITMEQNSSIVITDYQMRNTPSPVPGLPIDQVLFIEEFLI